MSADYKRMNTCLAAAADRALTMLEKGQPDAARCFLQSALLEAEDICLDTDDTTDPE